MDGKLVDSSSIDDLHQLAANPNLMMNCVHGAECESLWCKKDLREGIKEVWGSILKISFPFFVNFMVNDEIGQHYWYLIFPQYCFTFAFISHVGWGVLFYFHGERDRTSRILMIILFIIEVISILSSVIVTVVINIEQKTTTSIVFWTAVLLLWFASDMFIALIATAKQIDVRDAESLETSMANEESGRFWRKTENVRSACFFSATTSASYLVMLTRGLNTLSYWYRIIYLGCAYTAFSSSCVTIVYLSIYGTKNPQSKTISSTWIVCLFFKAIVPTPIFFSGFVKDFMIEQTLSASGKVWWPALSVIIAVTLSVVSAVIYLQLKTKPTWGEYIKSCLTRISSRT